MAIIKLNQLFSITTCCYVILVCKVMNGSGQGSSSNMRTDNIISTRSCPHPFEDWNPTSKHCYKIFLKKLNWTTAESNCKMLGGNLIAISSSQLSSIVKNKMKNQDHLGHLWIGLTKKGDEMWRWIDGTEFGFNNWASAEQRNALRLQQEHDDDINQDCISMSDATGFWYDHVLCSAPLRYVCQICSNGKYGPECLENQGQYRSTGSHLHKHNLLNIAMTTVTLLRVGQCY